MTAVDHSMIQGHIGPTFADLFLDDSPYARPAEFWPDPPAAPAEQQAAHDALLEAVQHALAAGEVVPCLALSADPRWWISDRSSEQALAARLCTDCPLRAACAEYGRTWEKSGVWGGVMSAAPRRPRPMPPPVQLDAQAEAAIAALLKGV
ncbi:WhiB family transcriptional regulator [Georgenia sp. AZ-5]|uniref:WhiB family transcriptional regulator n=1 Tax=Georgenia sp. AZ-5 TaxID=3367526 RepID=UPI00375504D9